MAFETKDSGARLEYKSGMVRDTNEGKARFDLIHPRGIPYKDQMITRFADLMQRGSVKYGDRNWEKAIGQLELNRFKESALRHMEQWFCGEKDEDHAAAVMFNIMAYETTKYKIENGRDKDSDNDKTAEAVSTERSEERPDETSEQQVFSEFDER